jgi:hypothetical protein
MKIRKVGADRRTKAKKGQKTYAKYGKYRPSRPEPQRVNTGFSG